MKMTKIYLAGAILEYDKKSILWRSYIKDKLGSDKYIYLDPTIAEIALLRPSDIINTDKKMIDECDLVLVDWGKISAGTSMEMIYAWERGKKIYVIDSGAPMSIWIKYHSDIIFPSADYAIDGIGWNYG